MVLVPQKLPWTPLPGREISDGDGNVVQYTQETIGQICLSVNQHDKLIDILGQVENWLRSDAATRMPDAALLELVSSATGRIGYGVLAAKLEGAAAGSPELDRHIARELNIPEAPYTSSTDAARTLIQKGWRVSDWEQERIDPATGQLVVYAAVELKFGDKVVVAESLHLPRSICAAALKTKEI